MPLYEYECHACGQRFEVIQKFSDPPADVCRVCGRGPVRKLLSSPAIQFKGSGWYVTDYARKSGETPGAGDSTKPAASKSSETASSDSSSAKPATPAPTSTPKDS